LKKKLQQAINGRDDNDNDGVRRRSVGNFRTRPLFFSYSAENTSESERKAVESVRLRQSNRKNSGKGGAVGQL
jgi:hypothetical protein